MYVEMPYEISDCHRLKMRQKSRCRHRQRGRCRHLSRVLAQPGKCIGQKLTRLLQGLKKRPMGGGEQQVIRRGMIIFSLRSAQGDF